MMLEFGAVDEDTMDDLEDEASNAGWESSKYAWIFNKLDNEIVDETKITLNRLGYNSDKVPFVPISGLDGDNISEARDSADSSWYHGWSRYVNGITEYPRKTLLETIDDMHLPGQKPTGSFRLPIQNVCHTPNVGTVVTGTVVAGTCWPGMYVTLAPNNIPVQSMQQHHESLDECSTGAIVGLCFGYTDSDGDDLDIRRGEVVSDSDNPASNCSSFTAQIIVTSHPDNIKSGYTPGVHCGTGRAPCRFEILDTMEARAGRRIGRKEAKNVQAAMVRMTPFCVEGFSDYSALGRVVVRDLGRTVAVGSVKSVEKC